MVAQRDIMTARIPGIGESGIEKIRAAKVLVVGAAAWDHPSWPIWRQLELERSASLTRTIWRNLTSSDK